MSLPTQQKIYSPNVSQPSPISQENHDAEKRREDDSDQAEGMITSQDIQQVQGAHATAHIMGDDDDDDDDSIDLENLGLNLDEDYKNAYGPKSGQQGEGSDHINFPQGRFSFVTMNESVSSSTNTYGLNETYTNPDSDHVINDEPMVTPSPTALSQSDANQLGMKGVSSILSVVRYSLKQTIGLAYYSSTTHSIQYGEINNIENMKQLKYQWAPSLILTSARPQEQLYHALAVDELDPHHVFPTITLKRTEFDHGTCVFKLRSVRFSRFSNTTSSEPEAVNGVHSSESEGQQHRNHEHQPHESIHWKSLVDFEKTTMVMALSGLLTYLLKHKTNHQDGLVHINSFQPIQATSVLLSDRVTIDALSIFVRERHPGTGVCSKEGLSLYGVLDHCKTKPGSYLLRSWIRHPSTDINIINDRHHHVDYFTMPMNNDLREALRQKLIGINDMKRIVNKCSAMTVKPVDLIRLTRSLLQCSEIIAIIASCLEYHAHQQARMMSNHHPQYHPDNARYGYHGGYDNQPFPQHHVPPQHAPNDNPCLGPRLLEEIYRANTPELRFIVAKLGKVLDLTSSRSNIQGLPVLPGVSPMIDYLRSNLVKLPDFLAQVLAFDLEEGLLPHLQFSEYDFLPQHGFFLKVQLTGYDQQTPIPHDMMEQYSIVLEFSTEDYCYFSNHRTHELNERLGDLHTRLFDEEMAVFHVLIGEVLSVSQSIESLADLICELDVLLCFATIAYDSQLVRPVITTENIIDIEEGQDVLLALVESRDAVVPNSIHIQNNYGYIHVITGPNNSGKSILLRQVGLTIFLAHIGCFVPAKRAVIGICDRVISCTHTPDSINNSLSTFAHDTVQVALMLRSITPSSCVLIDEYGSGTNTVDGIALCAAIIRYLASLKEACPKVMITTHFHEIITQGMIRETMVIRLHHMAYHLEQQSDQPSSRNAMLGKTADMLPQGRVVSMFKLKPGYEANSYGLSCALSAGVDMGIITRALEISQATLTNTAPMPIQADAYQQYCVLDGHNDSGVIEVDRSPQNDTKHDVQRRIPAPLLADAKPALSLEEQIKYHKNIIRSFLQLGPSLNEISRDQFATTDELESHALELVAMIKSDNNSTTEPVQGHDSSVGSSLTASTMPTGDTPVSSGESQHLQEHAAEMRTPHPDPMNQDDETPRGMNRELQNEDPQRASSIRPVPWSGVASPIEPKQEIKHEVQRKRVTYSHPSTFLWDSSQDAGD